MWFCLSMKLMFPLVALFLLALSGQAASLEGEILFSPRKSMTKGNAIRKEFGDQVKATTDWWLSTTSGREMLIASLSVTNTGPNPVWCSYYVAFYDKEKNLVCSGGTQMYDEEGVVPGKPVKTLPCVIFLPKDKYKDIFSFQAVLYEVDTPPPMSKKKKAPLLEDPEPKPGKP
jgi:hypothetical protein